MASEVQDNSNSADPLDLKVDELKAKANDQFKLGHYDNAIEFYTNAISIKSSAVLYANRAAAYLRTENFGLAIQDAKKAIELDKTYIKGYYRLGSAHASLGHLKDALKVFKKVVEMKPDSRDARNKVKQCKIDMRRIAFENAIAREATAPLIDTIDLNKFEVQDTYEGPRLGDDEEVTLKFAESVVLWMKESQVLHKRYVVLLLKRLKAHFASLDSLVEVAIPEGTEFTVCGDTHGQFFDLLNIFEINGDPSETNPYLFNGDFVDRGSWSVEVILTLFVYKLALPDKMHLLRGNHETRNMNRIYGFCGEVKAKYTDEIMQLFTEVFRLLPLAATLNKKVIIMHGGLFQRDGIKLEDIRKIDRNREPPEQGLMADILWSDPSPFPGRQPSKRGIGIHFGPDITKAFLEDNNLELLVRSHEVRNEGYLVEHDGKLVTVFSAPNYCDQVGNKGALIRFNSECTPHYKQFTAVPHPDIKPMAYATNMSLYGM